MGAIIDSMSADLFAAFGSSEEPSSSNKGNQQASTAASTSKQPDSLFDFPSSRQTSRQHDSVPSQVTKIEPIFQPANDGGNDVLFDASEGEIDVEDDDFGDFEDVERLPAHAVGIAQPPVLDAEKNRQPSTSHQVSSGNKAAGLIDLLSLDETPAQASEPHTQDSVTQSSIEIFNPSTNESRTNHTSPSAQPPTSPAQETDEAWGDFEAVSPTHRISSRNQRSKPPPPLEATTGMTSHSILHTLQPKTPEPEPNESENWDPFEDGTSISPPPQAPTSTRAQHLPKSASTLTFSMPKNAERPTNIPPPALLLSLLPTTFQSLVTLILSESTIPDLSDQITTAFRVSARIISSAARALRWRRDTILSQSTRIGVAGKSGGMKLSNLNKGESVREEREAAEAVEVWNSRIHYFLKILKASGTVVALKLSMTMPVKPLRGPGVIQATIVCPVCGLKRSERVVGADDVGVDDVFGEYWLENWGHRECAEWWYRWNGELGQR